MPRLRLSRSTLAALAAAWLGGVPAALAQQPSLIEQARTAQRLADQKAEADVAEALRDADKAANAAVAARSLKGMIYSLDKSVAITSEKRASLVKALEAKISLLEGKAPTVPTALTPAQQAERITANRALAEAAKKEVTEVRDAVVAVARLNDAGRVAEAQRAIADIAKKYPNNPATIVLSGQGAIADRVAVSREQARQQNERILADFQSIDRSALPARGDIEFDKNYAKRMEARDRLTAVQLTPDEEAILKSLETPVKEGIKDGPFEEVLQSLSNLIGKNIYIDPQSIAEDNRDLKKPVTMPGNVSARTALRAVVQSQGMTFIVKEKVIQVVSMEEARRSLVKRAYYLGDVLGSPIGNGVTLGPAADFALANQNANLIIDSIKKSIDPRVWTEQGGYATILFHAPSMSIVVSAPAEVHFDIYGAFKRPRK